MPSPSRDFLDLASHDPGYLVHVLNLAKRIKDDPPRDRPLEGRSLAMIFHKASTRTRASAEVAMTRLGGHALTMARADSQMGRGESLEDTARVLSRYVDAVLVRTYAHDDLLAFAGAASVPVVNGLTDRLHPCQLMADLLTVREEFGPRLEDRRVAWIGDGNNMANSWLDASRRFGFSLRLACPEGHDPDPEILRAALAGRAELVRSPAAAAAGADVVSTDVWASMGQEAEQETRAAAFAGFQVDEAVMAAARPDAIFLHCLPAHRGEEVAPEVIDGPRSRVLREAENRLHVAQALFLDLMG